MASTSIMASTSLSGRPAPWAARPSGRWLRAAAPPLLLIAAGLAAWQLVVTAASTNPQLLPGPWLIVRSTWDDRAGIWPAIGVTTEEALLGMAVAIVVAVLIAVSINSFRSVRGSLYPVIVASQTVPIIALAPLVLVWWGFGLFPKVILVALFSFFPITVGLVQGLGSASPDALNLLRTMRAGRWQLLTRVRLPNALPQFFTGLKISVTYAYSAAIVAEFVGGMQGLGVYMTQAIHDAPVRMDLVLGAVFVIALLTIAIFALVGIVERLAMPWRPRPAAPGPPATLAVHGVGKRFSAGEGEVVALASVDLFAAAGEFVSLIGPSGCGKSTLFNIVAGLERPSSGRVLINEVDLDDRLGASAYMPQHDALLGWRRVLDNVVLPLELAGTSRKEARKRAMPLLERFGLGEFAHAWPWQLSGGMRQRTAFLRTVIAGHPLMLLDEPFGALDGITRADLQEWLSKVWAEFGATVLLVTHDITEAVFLSDRVYVMTPRPGRVASVLEVDLPRPRRLGQREDEGFQALEARLRHELATAMVASHAASHP